MDYPKRKHPRLKDYDYSSNGTYYITICTSKRRKILCDIVGRDDLGTPPYVIKLTKYGEITDKYIKLIPEHYKNVSLDQYIIMPDHIHLLLSITKNTLQNKNETKSISIPQIITTLKKMIGKEIGVGLFQSTYYDHIIRDEIDYITKWNYIVQNPMRWLLKMKHNEL